MCIFLNLGFFSDDEAQSTLETDGLDVFGSDFDPNHVLEGDILSNIDYTDGNEVNEEGGGVKHDEDIGAGDIDGNLAPNHAQQELEERVIGEAIIIMKDQVVEADEHVKANDDVKE